MTQKDTNSYNDCENIKKIGDVQPESLLLEQQQQQQGQNIENIKQQKND